MIYLILAIFSSVMVSLIMRFSERKISNNVGLLLMNYIMCIILAVFFSLRRKSAKDRWEPWQQFLQLLSY